MALIIGLLFISGGFFHLYLFFKNRKKENLEAFFGSNLVGAAIIWIIYFW